jgi:release factor glutamine methyltransferase
VNLIEARRKLELMAEKAGVVNGARKARYIFKHYTRMSNEDVYRLGDDYRLAGWKYAQLVKAVNRLIDGTPVQLIIGYTHFYEDKFICRKGVMIPRPETETLVETAIRISYEKPEPFRLLDMFTGSGIAAISIAKTRPRNVYIGADASRKAVNLARLNASRLGADVTWRVGDMFAPFRAGRDMFDIICANPPYIPTGDLKRLPKDVRYGDPVEALDGGRDGLKFHKRLASEAPAFLKPGGCLVVEMGYDQRRPVREIFKPRKVEIVKDLWKKDRVYVVRF